MKSVQQRLSWRLRQFLLLCLFLPLSGNLAAGHDDGDLQRINAIKVAFVLNIARFVTWPPGRFASENEPLHLCIYRNNIYGDTIEEIRGKKIGKRRVEISTVDHLHPEDDCEILLIPHSESKRFSAEIQGGLERPLLTIADHTENGVKGVSRQGVLVTMVRQGTRIAFEIDPWQARRVNLQMSSELLKLARIVGEGT